MGIAHHLGWAVAVTASADYEVADRRRIELIEPGMPAAPVEHEAKPLSDDAAARMVARVWASALRATAASLDQLAASLPEPIVSLSLNSHIIITSILPLILPLTNSLSVFTLGTATLRLLLNPEILTVLLLQKPSPLTERMHTIPYFLPNTP